MVVKGYRVGPLLKKTGQEILDDNVLGLAAQTAYYFFFSLFPLFLFTAPLLSVLGDERVVFEWIISRVDRAIPASAIELVRGVVADVVFSESAPGLMSAGILLAVWAGSNVFGSLTHALNRAYDVEESRPWWRRKLMAIACVLASGICLGLATATLLAGTQIATWLRDNTSIGPTFESIWWILQYPLAFSMLVAMLFMTYYFLPNLKQHKGQVLVGAAAAALLWLLATLAFRAYVTNFGSYNKTYGTIGGVIVLLTWMYLTMLAILTGGELNAELHHGTGALDPRGGVIYAGRLVNATEPSRASTDRIDPVQPFEPREA
jgi:membrane protein